MKLLFVVLYQGTRQLDAVVRDRLGHGRRVRLSWHRRGGGDTPPKEWLKQIEGEVEVQIAEDHAKSKGRLLL